MNRTQNKTMAARLASLVVVALIAAAALPVAFVQKQGSIGEAIFSQLSKSKSKTSQVTVLPAPLESQETATVSESDLVRVPLGLVRVASPSRIRGMDVELTRGVLAPPVQLRGTDVALARGVSVSLLQRLLQDPLPSARLIGSRASLTFVDPELTVQEAGALKIKADAALMRLYLEPTRTVSFNKQKADQNEKYIALLEKYIALLEKHLRSLEGSGDTKVGYQRLLGRLLDDSKLPPRVVSDVGLYASPAQRAVSAAYVKQVLAGVTVNVPKAAVRSDVAKARIAAYVTTVANYAANVVVADQSKGSKGKVEVMVIEVGDKTFWIAARPNATVNVSTKEGTIQIVEADGKKFWVALRPGTVKAEGTKLEIKVVEIEGKKIWIVRTPRKKERADKKGG